MQKFDAADLTGPQDWSGPTLPAIGTAVAKFRWINTPYRWHRNTGAELFLVLEGEVQMHVRSHPDAAADIIHLHSGQSLLIEDGEEHVAYPCGEARVLVVEQQDSE